MQDVALNAGIWQPSESVRLLGLGALKIPNRSAASKGSRDCRIIEADEVGREMPGRCCADGGSLEWFLRSPQPSGGYLQLPPAP